MDNLPTVPDANAVPTAPISPIVPVAPTPTPAPVQAPVAPTPAPAVTPTQPVTTPLDPSLTPPSSSKKMIMIVVAILVVLGLAYVGYTSMTGSGDTSTTASTNSTTPPSLTVKSNGLKGSFSDVETTYNCMQFKDGEVASFKPDPGDASVDLVSGMNSLQIREDVSWLDAVKSIGPETGMACMAFYDTEAKNFRIYPPGPFEGTIQMLQKDLANEKFKAGQTAILFVRKPGKAYKYFSSAKTKGAKTFVPAAGIKGWSLHIASKDNVKDELAQFNGRASKIFVQAMNEKEKKEEFVKVDDSKKDTQKFDYNFLYWVYLDTPAGGVINGGTTETPKVAKITGDTVSPKNIVMDPLKSPGVNQTYDITVTGENFDTAPGVTVITSSDLLATVSDTKVEEKKISFKLTTTPKTTEGDKTFTVKSKDATVVGTFKITASRLVDTSPSDMVFAPTTIELQAGANPALTTIPATIKGKNLDTIASIATTYADIKIVPITFEAKDITSTEVKFGISVAPAAKPGTATFIAKDKAGKEIKSFVVTVVAAGAPTVASPVITSPINKAIIDTSKELKFEWTAVTTLPSDTSATYVTNIMKDIVTQDKFAPTAKDQDSITITNVSMPQNAVAQLPAGDYTYGVKTVAIDTAKKVVATSPWAVSSFTIPAASSPALKLKIATDTVTPLAPTDVKTDKASYSIGDLKTTGITFSFTDPNTTSYVKDSSSGKYLSNYAYSITKKDDLKNIPWTSGWETTESQTIIDKCQTKVKNEFTTPAQEAVYWTCKLGTIKMTGLEITKFKNGIYTLNVVAGDGKNPSVVGMKDFTVTGAVVLLSQDEADALRLKDMQVIKTAIDSYYTTNKKYPTDVANTFAIPDAFTKNNNLSGLEDKPYFYHNISDSCYVLGAAMQGKNGNTGTGELEPKDAILKYISKYTCTSSSDLKNKTGTAYLLFTNAPVVDAPIIVSPKDGIELAEGFDKVALTWSMPVGGTYADGTKFQIKVYDDKDMQDFAGISENTSYKPVVELSTLDANTLTFSADISKVPTSYFTWGVRAIFTDNKKSDWSVGTFSKK